MKGGCVRFMHIGKHELQYGLILAPMAGFSDRAMRKVCYERGAEYSVTEMVSATAICYNDKKTSLLAKILPDEGPCALQLFGKDPEKLAHAAEVMQKGVEGASAPVAIDINMGCPVNKIFSNGEGSALMKDPELIYKICRAVSSAIDIPLSVKIRAGVDSEHKNAVECALAAESGGTSLVGVHGRTRVEMYSGTSDMEIIKKVKQSLHIPVVANGDVTSAESALRLLEYTGADGIMVGRAAIGNPFIFGEIRAALAGEKYKEPTLKERIETALYELRIAIEEKGEGVAVRESRKRIAFYLRSFRGAAMIRAAINRAETYEDVKTAMNTALSNEE